ncbi:MAG TPA: DUF2079 domain-containing protein, partial [Candidatus Sulfotelmatobacter sp.]|nr:DUF2079 domain-containing protein [Candidatus Sulfotelmatobacter sp.]
FIVSELIFLGLVLFFEKIKNIYILLFLQTVKKYKYEFFLIVSILIYVLYFTAASFLRYDNFFAGRFDLGNMDQTVWNTIHGRIFQMTNPNATNEVSRLIFHSDFLLILISPLYFIWSSPKMLLLLQSLILGFGAFFVFLIAKNLLKEKKLALTFSIIYLLNPSLQFANLYDFHPVTLGTTLLLATFYFFIKKRYLLFLFFSILAGLAKEEVWAIVSIFGFAVILRVIFENKFKLNLTKKQVIELIFGFFVWLISALIFYLLIWIVIPYMRGGQHFALSYYSDFGGSPSEVSKNIILMPMKTIYVVLSPERLNYLLQLFLPVGFVSIFSPFFLIFSAPDLLINLLSSNKALHEIYYQYTSPITPFIIISAIYAVSFIKKSFSKIRSNLIIGYLIITTFLSASFFGPLPGSFHANLEMFNDQISNKKTIDDFLSKIPTRYSIAASNNLGSHLSHRRNLYTIPIGIDKADVVLFLLNDYWAQPSLPAQKQMAQDLKNNKDYIQVFRDGDFIAFEKRNLYLTSSRKPKKGLVNLFPYSIQALSSRSYKASEINIEGEVSTNGNFKSYIISFISDGLKEYALMNIPNSRMPSGGYPVLVLNHGYIQPSIYNTINSYKSDSDYFANQGFIVLKPDYRGNANSEIDNKALMRFAYPIDVLNLISSVQNIKVANSNKIFLWSHSMGGEVTLTDLEAISKNKELADKIKGAVFWAPVTDPVKWFSKNHLPKLPEARISPYPYSETFKILGTPEENPKLWALLSPLNYLKNINVPILLQHGTGDNTVPYVWSVELDRDLKTLNKNVSFVSYRGDDHNLPNSWGEAVSKDVEFYNYFLQNN